MREHEGVGAEILRDFDADAETIRREVIRIVGGRARGERDPDLPAVGSPRTMTLVDPVRPPRSLHLLVAIVLAAVGFPLGLLVGWLVWGSAAAA